MGEEIRNKLNTSDQDDTELLKAFRGRERDMFDTLVLKHQNRVFNLCYRLLGDYEEANDCAQETFVKAYRSLGRFRFKSTFSTWLYAIAVNTCKNRVKSSEYRHRKKMVRLGNPVETENGSYTVEVGDESQSPVKKLEKKETGELIQEAINSLPEEQRTVIVLRDIQGISYEEIARITGYNPGTVKSKIARAREKLRESLKGVR